MNLLFPTKFKWIGLAIFIPSAILGVLIMINNFEFSWLDFGTTHFSLPGKKQENWTNELAFGGLILGMAMISFSKMKWEDEWIQKIRLEAFILAFQISLFLLFLCNFLFFFDDFLQVLIYNTLTPLLLFNLVFWLKFKRANKDLEEV